MWFCRLSDEIVEKKFDTLLQESFAERPHDFNHAPSVNDKIVLEKYKGSIKAIDNRYQIELPFKKDNVIVSDNYQYALNSLFKLEQYLKRHDELRINYFNLLVIFS